VKRSAAVDQAAQKCFCLCVFHL